MSRKCKLGAEAACAGFKGRVFVVQEQVAQVLKEEPDGIHTCVWPRAGCAQC